ncbi:MULTISPECIES: hypothetical protein [Chryseobacterium]|uniref:RteC protein n=1 Tax=Chryseobacterium geocarposphaerae TaxID=1416776 RepID=A0ABU1LB71_9FLAO|nr:MULTISPECIES: hypothetical protein [Chryseobacterium]MDR6403969.1 hypothetical protein [Chryseobacterium geocarposphaerae]MDR6698512.1 hypothetical protein [Chryseobacterium ginsenosidimutans]
MEAKKHQKELEELRKESFINKVLSYEADFIKSLEKSINFVFKKFNAAFELKNPMDESEVLQLTTYIQTSMLETFSLSTSIMKIFDNFNYAVNEEDGKVYFESECILEVFTNYLSISEFKLEFDKENPIFGFLYYLYYSEVKEHNDEAYNILIDFHFKLYGSTVYRDFFKIMKFINRDFVISPNDNHIPIRIALLDSLNLINDLNNNVPNKENIYRIIHAIVGGNEDNVKKYCLSLIGKNSLSQKQITRKHKEFAQRYINEKKL